MTGLLYIITCKIVDDRSECSYVLLLVKVLMTGLGIVMVSGCSYVLLLVRVLLTGLSVVMYYYLYECWLYNEICREV